jgi:hypothetical protein
MCAQPSVDERIVGLRRDVNALFRLLPDNIERGQEELRRRLWWETYNAILPRVAVFREVRDGDIRAEGQSMVLSLAYTHIAASAYADHVHGPLNPKEA